MAFTPPECQHNYRVLDFNGRQMIVYCTKCLDIKTKEVPNVKADIPMTTELPDVPLMAEDEAKDIKNEGEVKKGW